MNKKKSYVRIFSSSINSHIYAYEWENKTNNTFFFQEKNQIIKLKTYSLEFQNQLHSVHHPGMPISNYLKKKNEISKLF